MQIRIPVGASSPAKSADINAVINPYGVAITEVGAADKDLATTVVSLASTSALIGRALNVDRLREQAARVAAREIEILTAGCRGAASGHQSWPQIESEWSVSRPDASRIDVTESVSYSSSQGRRTDSYRALVGCP